MSTQNAEELTFTHVKRIAENGRGLAWNNFRVTTISASLSLLNAVDNYTYQKAAYALDLVSAVVYQEAGGRPELADAVQN